MEIFIPWMTRAIFALFFILHSCTPCNREWFYQEVRAESPCVHSKRILLLPENPYRGIGLQFVRTCSGERAYLDIYSLCFPKDMEEPDSTLVRISSDAGSYEFRADRLEGGQRLLLPGDAESFLIEQLLNCRTLTISAGRYQDEITPRAFREAYRKYCRD